jgi:hypothetical protein
MTYEEFFAKAEETANANEAVTTRSNGVNVFAPIIGSLSIYMLGWHRFKPVSEL